MIEFNFDMLLKFMQTLRLLRNIFYFPLVITCNEKLCNNYRYEFCNMARQIYRDAIQIEYEATKLRGDEIEAISLLLEN